MELLHQLRLPTALTEVDPTSRQCQPGVMTAGIRLIAANVAGTCSTVQVLRAGQLLGAA